MDVGHHLRADAGLAGDAADARGVRWADARIQLAGSVTQLGSGLDAGNTRSTNVGAGHQPLFDISDLLDHPHAVALRRTHVSTLAAMSMILPACDAALLAFVLGPSRFAQVLVETTTVHGALRMEPTIPFYVYSAIACELTMTRARGRCASSQAPKCYWFCLSDKCERLCRRCATKRSSPCCRAFSSLIVYSPPMCSQRFH